MLTIGENLDVTHSQRLALHFIREYPFKCVQSQVGAKIGILLPRRLGCQLLRLVHIVLRPARPVEDHLAMRQF